MMPARRNQTAFVAGASGAIGEVLCRLLIAAGWQVHGSTRHADKATHLRSLGVTPAIVDVYDHDALTRAVCQARPGIVVHQLTDLPKHYDPATFAAARAANARLREIGTDHLVTAALAAGAQRIVAQSIAFAYAAGPMPYTETDPLDASQHAAVLTLERLVLNSGLDGVVLRYGRLYGPGTWSQTPSGPGSVHVHAAAEAAFRAMTLAIPGVYNIAEEDGTVDSAKARQTLHWNPGFRWASA